ncbi:hypothetical protein [Mesorhizobium sp.]|uniref:hypothetical protein n=1 Tax=Mesorhizobium sp. TaxID=1871066 RepID=UPI0025FF468A|nr:hypothetical protein [Mesorhizobium sp.]
MAIEERKYPGELASPQQVHELAEEYRKAANHLFQIGRPGKPLEQSRHAKVTVDPQASFVLINALKIFLENR